jgi:hypothetical protein
MFESVCASANSAATCSLSAVPALGALAAAAVYVPVALVAGSRWALTGAPA